MNITVYKMTIKQETNVFISESKIVRPFCTQNNYDKMRHRIIKLHKTYSSHATCI